MKSAEGRDQSRREWLGVVALAVIGFGLRAWPIGRLGFSHFDEGIYALTALWSRMPGGLATLSPMVISYAPPGYPILGGIAYVLLGQSDGAMIAISQVAGTLTIPMVAWLARRTFGPGSGFAAATFCALSGPHIAYSRMALTDTSFLLAWLVAIGFGMRFLERPGFIRALFMGGSVGLAQQFKYNGWLIGGIVAGSAVVSFVVRSESRRLRTVVATFGWGGLGAGIAWLVVWPWFAFVEAHGGYSALLRHQRNYLGGLSDWPRHYAIQASEASALSGGPALIGSALVIVWLVQAIDPCARWSLAVESWSVARRLTLAVGSGVVMFGFVAPPFLLGLLLLPWLTGVAGRRITAVFGRAPDSAMLIGVWWLGLTILTPFYHPYARLWLPYHAAHWVLLGWLVAVGLPTIVARLRDLSVEHGQRRPVRVIQAMSWVVILSISVILLTWGFAGPASLRTGPSLFAPSDSLYRATQGVSNRLTTEVRGLRTLVRPPVSFYLAGRVPLLPMADAEPLRKRGDPAIWALVDSAVFPGQGRRASGTDGRDQFAEHWEIVEAFPTDPGLPTLLDLDPDFAWSALADRSYPLWLLRPRTAKAPR